MLNYDFPFWFPMISSCFICLVIPILDSKNLGLGPDLMNRKGCSTKGLFLRRNCRRATIDSGVRVTHQFLSYDSHTMLSWYGAALIFLGLKIGIAPHAATIQETLGIRWAALLAHTAPLARRSGGARAAPAPPSLPQETQRYKCPSNIGKCKHDLRHSLCKCHTTL